MLSFVKEGGRNSMDKYTVLYHGTTSSKLDRIKQEGLRKSSKQDPDYEPGDTPRISLTKDPTYAACWGNVVLKVRVPTRLVHSTEDPAEVIVYKTIPSSDILELFTESKTPKFWEKIRVLDTTNVKKEVYD